MICIVQASIYKEGSFGYPLLGRLKSKSKEPSIFRVRVRFKNTTDHFNTSAYNSSSAKRNAVYRFCLQNLSVYDNRDFDRLSSNIKSIAIQQMIKEVNANGKVNIVR